MTIAMNSRKIELTEKLNRLDYNINNKDKEKANLISEKVDENDFSNSTENYIMNRV